METVWISNENAEKETRTKLHVIALKMIEVATVLGLSIRRANEQEDPGEKQLGKILLEKAEIKHLEREVDEVIRNHNVRCPCGCGKIRKLREMSLRTDSDNVRVVTNCPNRGQAQSVQLDEATTMSILNVTKFASVSFQDLFDK